MDVSTIHQIDLGFVKTFLEKKMVYNASNAAVRLANAYGASAIDLDHLIQCKQKSKQSYMTDEQRLARLLPWDTNLARLNDGWYIVRYMNDRGDPVIKVDLFIDKDVYMLERHNNQHDFNRVELELLLPAYIDEPALSRYKQLIHDEAIKVLMVEAPSVSIPEVERAPCDSNLTVSSHAGKRWVQRCMGIESDTLAEAYRKAHVNEVTSAVVEGCSNAQLLWEEPDGVQYKFDANNIVYLVGNHNVITVYEEDFNFDKSINREIVLRQMRIIEEVNGRLKVAEKSHASVVKRVESELLIKDHEIAVLNAKLDLLVAQKNNLVAEKDISAKSVRVEQEAFNAEFKKLFKRWEVK